jgi:hypothetical protein
VNSMAKSKIVTLRAKRVVFYSQFDESLFFKWLKKIPAIRRWKGVVDTLHIDVETAKVDEYNLREFLALFHRYRVDTRQLRAFDRPDFASWFHNRRAYWFREVFGPAKRGTRKRSNLAKPLPAG